MAEGGSNTNYVSASGASEVFEETLTHCVRALRIVEASFRGFCGISFRLARLTVSLGGIRDCVADLHSRSGWHVNVLVGLRRSIQMGGRSRCSVCGVLVLSPRLERL